MCLPSEGFPEKVFLLFGLALHEFAWSCHSRVTRPGLSEATVKHQLLKRKNAKLWPKLENDNSEKGKWTCQDMKRVS